MSDVEDVEPVPAGMPAWLPDAFKAARWPFVFALVAAGILLLTFTWLVGQLGSFLTMIGIALFLSFALEPAVDYLATRGWKRGTATGLIFLILFGAIVLLVALIVPAVISGFNQLVQNAPALVDRLSNWLRPLGIKLSTDELIQKLQENAQQVISSATNVAGTVFGIASSLIGGLFRWATIALFTFYFVADGPRFRRALLSRMRPDRQERVLFVWEQAIRQTGGYFYSRLLLAVINGAGMYATLRITNVPFAAPLAIFEGSSPSSSRSSAPTSGARCRSWSPSWLPRRAWPHRQRASGRSGTSSSTSRSELHPQPADHREDDVAPSGGRVRRGADRRGARWALHGVPRPARRGRDPGVGGGMVPELRGGP